MARIPHGQPNQAFPSSSCSVILVTFPPPPPPPPPPPRLFLSLPAVTARSLSSRHARRLASIRILRKQTKEPKRLRETARETTSSEPNSCYIFSPYPATREIRLLFAPDELLYLRATLDSITKDKRGEAYILPLGAVPVPCYAKLKGGFCLSLKTGGVEISGERHSEKVCKSLSSYQQRVRSQQRSGCFQATPLFGGRVLKTRSSIRGSQVVEMYNEKQSMFVCLYGYLRLHVVLGSRTAVL